MRPNLADDTVKVLIKSGYGPELSRLAVDEVLKLLVDVKPEEISTRFIKVGMLDIDTQLQLVSVNGVNVSISAKQFKFLEYFARRPNQVISLTQILNDVWGQAYKDGDYQQYVRVMVSALRTKLGDDVIKSRNGAGYYLEAL